MGDVTRDFSRHEFECRCGCGLADPHPLLVVGLQQLRDLAGVPFRITSGCRCEQHNSDEGGSPRSQHLPDQVGYTRAVDGRLEGLSLGDQYELAQLVDEFDEGGIGLYVGSEGGPRMHLDVRGKQARWAYSKTGRLVTIEAALKEAGR